MSEISEQEIHTMLKLVAMGETDLIPDNKLSAALQKIRSMQAENATLKTKIEQMQETIAYDAGNYLTMQADNARLRNALEHICEYWNGGNESAVDAIEEAISAAEDALQIGTKLGTDLELKGGAD